MYTSSMAGFWNFFSGFTRSFSPILNCFSFFKKKCHSLLSISGINIYWKQLEEGKAYFILYFHVTVHHWGESGQELRKNPWRESCLLSSSPELAQPCTTQNHLPREWDCLQWAGASLVNHLSWKKKKKTQRLPIGQFKGQSRLCLPRGC